MFQDGSQQDKSNYSSQKESLSSLNGSGSLTGREKERGRYAQLVGENRQVFMLVMSSK